MKSKIIVLSLTLLIAACATDDVVLAPDTRSGDQLKHEYLVGKWCTNRELTSKANTEAGNSALLNLSKEFWNFRDSGNWENSESGWMYTHYGEWKLQGRDTVILAPDRGNTSNYHASFRNSGVDLYLKDQKEQFLVLSRCD